MVSHGGDIYSYNKNINDFSANINPFGVSKKILKAMKNTDITVYPDPFCKRIIKELAKEENTDEKNIICGNGAAQLIYNIVFALMPKNVLLIQPSFSEYESACDAVNANKKFYILREENNFKIREDILNYVDSVDMIFICNPNNPTGKTANKEIIYEIIKKCSEQGIITVIDECFMDFANKYTMVGETDEYKNLIIIKAFTKMYAMPGIRFGFCICTNEKIKNKIYAVRQPWSVSSVAQNAALAATGEKDIPKKTRKLINKERIFLENEFDKLKIKYFKSETNFILFKEKANFDKELLKYNILIRNCNNFKGLADNEYCYYRIAIKKHSDNKKLIRKIKKIKR